MQKLSLRAGSASPQVIETRAVTMETQVGPAGLCPVIDVGGKGATQSRKLRFTAGVMGLKY